MTTFRIPDEVIDALPQQEIDAWGESVPWPRVAEALADIFLSTLDTSVPYDAHRTLARLLEEHWLGGDYAAGIAVELGFARPFWAQDGAA